MTSLLKSVRKYPFNPYSYYLGVGIPRSKIDKAFMEDVRGLIRSKAKIVRFSQGFAIYRPLSFDTKMLGKKTAKVDYFIAKGAKNAMSLAAKLVDSFVQDRLEYATVRVSTKDIEAIHSLEASGFRIVDAYLIHLQRELNEGYGQVQSGIKIRNARNADIKILAKTVGSAFIYSRFFMDPVIAKKNAVRIFQEWISNSIKKKVADQVLVAQYKDRPVGFITLEMDKKAKKYFGLNAGHIPLIGVNPKYQGRGIGEKLTKAAFDGWFKEKKAEAVRIETQLANIPATRAYEKLGFRLVDGALTLRWYSS